MIVVTGATGRLGRRVVQRLHDLAPGQDVVAAARRPGAAANLGVEVRRADYDDPSSLVAAFRGAERVLLVSGTEIGQRVRQHTAAVAAAVEQGVRQVVYTSAPRVDSTALVFGAEHLATERALRASGLRWTVLRNNWYHENYAPIIREAARTGEFSGSAGQGRVASAALADYADAAAIVLARGGHEDAVYELAGDVAWTYDELAGTIGLVAGRHVVYRDVPNAEHRARLVAGGADPGLVDAVAGIDANIAAGALERTDGSLRRLLGRPTVRLADAVRAVLGPGDPVGGPRSTPES